jgi:hypothetical protein
MLPLSHKKVPQDACLYTRGESESQITVYQGERCILVENNNDVVWEQDEVVCSSKNTTTYKLNISFKNWRKEIIFKLTNEKWFCVLELSNDIPHDKDLKCSQVLEYNVDV